MAQNRQRSYANAGRRNIQFDIGELAYLKVSPMKGVKRFGMSKKLSPRYIGPFLVIKQVGEVAYKLELPESLSGIHNVFHVSMLRKCLQEPDKYIDIQAPQLQEDLTYEEYPIRILDIKERKTALMFVPSMYIGTELVFL